MKTTCDQEKGYHYSEPFDGTCQCGHFQVTWWPAATGSEWSPAGKAADAVARDVESGKADHSRL